MSISPVSATLDSSSAGSPVSDWLGPEVLRDLLQASDVLLLGSIGLVALAVQDLQQPEADVAVWSLVAGLLLALQLAHLSGAYRGPALLEIRVQLFRMTTAWLAMGLAIHLVSAATGTFTEATRLWLVVWLVGGTIGIGLSRALLHLLVRRWQRVGRLVRNVAIIGAGDQGKRLVDHLRRTDRHIRLIGLFDDRSDRVPEFVAGYPVLGTVEDLLTFARRNRIDEVMVALPWGAESRLLECLGKLRGLPANIRLCSDLIGFHLPHRGITRVGGVPVLEVFDRPLTGWAIVIKSLEDRILAGLGIVALAPLIASIALAVRLGSPGPAFYRQKRWGIAGEEIEVLKFRTMRQEACDAGTEPDLPHAAKDDPRVTPIGRWLRKTSLDELPQLWNVLKGEMSLVGPRPHAVSHNERYAKIIERYIARHRVKPGITGWAQINGLRGEVSTVAEMERRVEHDLYYIQNWSVALDAKILMRTVLTGFADPRAY